MDKNSVIVRPARKDRGEDRHPWIYKSRIVSVGAGVAPGDVVTVVDRKGAFVGRGYYNPASMISIRLMTRQDEYIDKGLFDRRIAAACKKRKDMDLHSNAYRLIFSEADELPGLVVDIYANTAVFQTFTLGMEKLKDLALESLKDIAAPSRIYEKSDSFIRDREGLSACKGWRSTPGDRYIEIFEGAVKYCVDIEEGHKTGFYLDQRRSRMAFSRIARDKKVLDLFCYTGGFGVACAVYGASSVLAVDTKEDWLELGRKNAAKNGVAEKIKFVKGDSFSILEGIAKKKEKKFDIIILDPPSFLRNKSSLRSAIAGYGRLNTMAMNCTEEGGILCTFSCSHNMTNDIFSSMLKEAACKAHKRLIVLKRCHQAQDHPIVRAIPETEYLKGYFLRISPDGSLSG